VIQNPNHQKKMREKQKVDVPVVQLLNGQRPAAKPASNVLSNDSIYGAASWTLLVSKFGW
jgi:hypothetical protein